MIKKFRTYLAGAFCPYKDYRDWRDLMHEKVHNKRILLHDPRDESNQLCPATFTIDDARGVLKSDIILHARFKGYEDEGASWEHGIAFGYNLGNPDKKQKLIIYADETDTPFPLHFGSANVTFNRLETAVDFLNSLDSLEKFEWFQSYNALLDRARSKE